MKVSILTPSFNCAQFFPHTMRSILGQQGDFELEWLVLDGGSTDGTLNLLRQCDDKRLRWISEPDGGQSAALNKGLAMARGDIIGWLNADDLYEPGALAAVVDQFSARPDVQWLVGRCRIIDADGRIIRRGLSAYKDRHLRYFAHRKLLRENMICQPSVFWRADFGRAVGPLDESLHYTMDYDLWLRMSNRCPPLFLDRVLACFRLHKSSKSGRTCRRQFVEQYEVARRYLHSDSAGCLVHRVNIEKIVWTYRFMRWIGY